MAELEYAKYSDPSVPDVTTPLDGTEYWICVKDGTSQRLTTAQVKAYVGTQLQTIAIACSDETTALTTGAGKATFRMPYGFNLAYVRASVTNAPTGAVLTVNIKRNGATIFTTKITIEVGEKSSFSAAVQPVLNTATLSDDDEITVDIDTVGSTVAGAGLKVYLVGSPS